MPTARTSTTSNFALTLDGVTCGSLASVGGGDISADVIEVAVGSSDFVEKHIGEPKYEDFTLQIGLGMAQGVYDWIADSWAGAFARKDGSITTADAAMNAQSERQFFHAVLTETTIPGLDASSKDAGLLTLSFSPELTKTTKGSGGKVPVGAGQKQKPWLTSRFRLELDGLDCSRVAKIDSFTVERIVQTDEVGDTRIPTKKPGKLRFPNLRVTLAEGPAVASWYSWFDDFVVKGNNGDGMEKSGAIVFLGPDLQAELGRVVLHNVGIFALRHPMQQSQSEKVQMLTAELYCERMELQIGKPAPKPEPAPARVVDPGRIIGIRR